MMLYNYLALLVFALIAIFVPASLLATAKLFRHRTRDNAVKSAPYESAEATIGKNRDVINEYLPFFMLFLPFEVVAIVLLIWSSVLRQVSYTSGILVVGLALVAAAFSLTGYLIIRGKDGG